MCTVVLSECAWPEYSLTISTVDFSLFPNSRVEELGVLEVMVKLKRWPNTSLEAEATHGQKTRSSNPKYKYTSEHWGWCWFPSTLLQELRLDGAPKQIRAGPCIWTGSLHTWQVVVYFPSDHMIFSSSEKNWNHIQTVKFSNICVCVFTNTDVCQHMHVCLCERAHVSYACA